MFKAHILKVALALGLCSASNGVFAQNAFLNPNDFEGIKAKGTIPSDFTQSWSDKFQSALTNNLTEGETFEEFWSSQFYLIDEFIQSGSISFNDPVSVYLNKIKDELLKNDPVLKEKVRVYLYKSPSVNATAVADGMIFIYSGLFASCSSEAELAFVLAHEIQHYKQKHHLQDFEEREKILEESVKAYRNLHPLKKRELLTMQSKEHEIEADKKGVELYAQSAYAKSAPNEVLTILHESYMPYGRKEVAVDFLATNIAALPPIFYRDKISPIAKEENYFDETHSHPNIATRRAELKKAKQPVGDKYFIVESEKHFQDLRDLCRFERIRELVIYGMYGDALYDIYCLRDEYPQSKFLDLQEAKAMYGLAAYKASGGYTDVARSTSGMEGPSQQVHHIIKQFDKNQICSYAMHFVREAHKKYPEEEFLNRLEDELGLFMYVECKLNPEDFKTKETRLPEFIADEELKSNARALYRAQQKHYKEFYRYILFEDEMSGWLGEQLLKHKHVRDSIANYYSLSADDKENIKDERQRRLEETGNVKVNNLLLLDPTLLVRGEKNDAEHLQEAKEQEQEYIKKLPEMASEAGLNIELFFSQSLTSADVVKYNQLATIKEWISETLRMQSYGLYPTSVNLAQKQESVLNSRYLGMVKGIVKEGKDYYGFAVYDMKKGRLVYVRSERKGYNLSLRDMEKETLDDFERLKK